MTQVLTYLFGENSYLDTFTDTKRQYVTSENVKCEIQCHIN